MHTQGPFTGELAGPGREEGRWKHITWGLKHVEFCLNCEGSCGEQVSDLMWLTL